MQTITRILKTTGVVGAWAEERGDVADTPVLTLGTRVKLRIDLRTDELSQVDDFLIPLKQEDLICQSYYIALDVDFLQSTTPKLLNTSGLSIETDEAGHVFFVGEIPNTALPDLVAWVGIDKEKTINGEIGGFSSEDPDVASFVFQFSLNFRNRVWMGGTVPAGTQETEYWNVDQIKAYLAQKPEVRYSVDALDWHSIPDFKTDNYRSWRIGENGIWSDPEPLPRGADGKDFAPDEIGPLADRPTAPEEGYCYITTDTREIFWYLAGAWTDGISTGLNGEGIYELAVRKGFEGTEEQYLASLVGRSAYEEARANGYIGTSSEWLDSLQGKNAYELAVMAGYEGTLAQWLDDLKGADGSAIKPDAVGEPSELAAYGEERAGFIFACSAWDAENRYCDVSYYIKKSEALNDWFPPLVIRNYGRNGIDGQNIALIEPLVFKREYNDDGTAADYEWFAFNISAKYPQAHVSCVCIDTENGEYRLPYNSAMGIEKIYRQGGGFKIYFGKLCPAFETGKIYFAQGGVSADYFGDAPSDGKMYVRCNGEWVAISGTLDPDTPDPEPEKGTMFYGYVMASDTVYKVSGLTADMLSVSTVKSAKTSAMNKTSLGDNPAGALVFVAIPKADGMRALKFDGIGGYVEFEPDNGATGTGANGAEITLNETAYLVYGEFALVDGECFVKVEAN